VSIIVLDEAYHCFGCCLGRGGATEGELEGGGGAEVGTHSFACFRLFRVFFLVVLDLKIRESNRIESSNQLDKNESSQSSHMPPPP